MPTFSLVLHRPQILIISVLLCITLYIFLNCFVLTTTEFKRYIYIVANNNNNNNNFSNANSYNEDMLYIITQTYTRLTQRAELTRLRNALSHVNLVHWIIVEDRADTTEAVADVLETANVYQTTQLAVATNNACTREGGDRSSTKCPRGFKQRNLALDYIISLNPTHGSVIYFADDDNSYDVRIFEEMRNLTKFATWPVGFLGKRKYRAPICDENGKVIDFYGWKGFPRIPGVPGDHRQFPIDMAAFAFKAGLLLTIQPFPKFTEKSSPGPFESDFIGKLIKDKSEIETKPNCRTVWVWHTQTKIPDTSQDELDKVDPEIVKLI